MRSCHSTSRPPRQRGRLLGTLESTGRALLHMARHRAGIVVTIPRAGWCRLFDKRVVLRGEHALVKLRAIDVERHQRRQRGGWWWFRGLRSRSAGADAAGWPCQQFTLASPHDSGNSRPRHRHAKPCPSGSHLPQLRDRRITRTKGDGR
jgi:hypothetical protein